MDRDTKILGVVGGVLVVGGAVAYALRGRVADVIEIQTAVKGHRVGALIQQERYLTPTHAKIRAFFTEWKRTGPFGLFIPNTGGLRTDEAKQAQFAAQGVSKAAALKDTAHGRGGAADAYPVLNGRIYGSEGETDWKTANELFDEYGRRAEAAGLKWGGRWVDSFPPGPKNPQGGDRPHVEVPEWRSLPMPTVAKVS